MTPDAATTPDAGSIPGNLTVPPLFGWEGLVVLLVLAVVTGVGYLLLSAVSSSRRPSEDWDAWLQGRSRARHGIADEPAAPRPAVPPSDAPAEQSGAHPSR